MDLFIPTEYLVKAFQEKNAREMPEYLVLLMRAAGVGGLSFPTLVRPRLLAVGVLQPREHTIQPHHLGKSAEKSRQICTMFILHVPGCSAELSLSGVARTEIYQLNG
jgi:hypothetical protein